MWLLVRLGISVLMAGNLLAMQSAAAFVSRVAVRRSSALGIVTKGVQLFKADVAIAFEEMMGPRDPFLLHLEPTAENHAFEEQVMQRRIKHGLSPIASKR